MQSQPIEPWTIWLFVFIIGCLVVGGGFAIAKMLTDDKKRIKGKHYYILVSIRNGQLEIMQSPAVAFSRQATRADFDENDIPVVIVDVNLETGKVAITDMYSSWRVNA